MGVPEQPHAGAECHRDEPGATHEATLRHGQRLGGRLRPAGGEEHHDVGHGGGDQGERRHDVNHVPGIADPGQENRLVGEDDPGDDRDDRRHHGEIAGQLHVRHPDATIIPPVAQLVPGERRHEDEADGGVDQHRHLIGDAERKQIDGQAGDRLEDEHAGHARQQAALPLALPCML